MSTNGQAKADIFAAFAGRATEIVSVPVPEIGQSWLVKEFTKEEDVHFVDRLDEFGQAKKGNAWLACCAVCDESGARIFADEDVERIAAFPPAVLRRIYRVAGKLNGMRDEDFEDAKKN